MMLILKFSACLWLFTAAAWEPFLAQVVAQAQKQQKRVLIRVDGPNCKDCKKLDQILAKAKLENMLRAYYHAEKGEGQDVAKRYHVVAFPTVLIVEKTGVEKGRITGVQDWQKKYRGILDGSRSLLRLEAKLATGLGDSKLRLQVGTELALKGERKKALKHLDLVIAQDKVLAKQAKLVKRKYGRK